VPTWRKWGQCKCGVGFRDWFRSGENRGRVLWCGVREAPVEVIDPVAGECEVKYGKERGRGSSHGYIYRL
jgi:hypothetical protein